MMNSIQPNQYFAIKKHVQHLINTYHSVNDQETIQTIQAVTLEKIDQLVPEANPVIADLKKFILDQTLTRAKTEAYFETVKENVAPFQQPSNKQVEKTFRKVKKLKLPAWDRSICGSIRMSAGTIPAAKRNLSFITVRVSCIVCRGN